MFIQPALQLRKHILAVSEKEITILSNNYKKKIVLNKKIAFVKNIFNKNTSKKT